MKKVFSHFMRSSLWVSAIWLLGLSACKTETFEVPANVGTIRFSESSYTVELNQLDSTLIRLPLSLPLESDATVTVKVDELSTADPSEYTLLPTIPTDGLRLDLKKGDTEVVLKVLSQNNFEGEKTLMLNLSNANGGLLVSNTNAQAKVILKGNPLIYPEIKLSLTDMAFGLTAAGTSSLSQTYLLSGVKLTGNVSLLAAPHFEISQDDNVFSQSLTIPMTVLGQNSLALYVRFTPTSGANQSIMGTITHSSPGIPDAVIKLSGVETGNIIPGILIAKNDLDHGATSRALTLASGGQWVGFSATGSNPVQYIPAGLSYPGYPGSGMGGALTMENRSASSEDVSWSFAAQSSGAIYTAQLLNFVSAPVNQDFFLSLGDGNAGTTPGYFNRIYAKQNGPNFGLGIGRNSATSQYDPMLLDYGTTYLVVHKYEFTSGQSSLFILSGAIPEIEPAVPGASSTSGSADPAAITRYVVRQSTGLPLKVTIDGIRVATSWKDAVGK